MYDGRLEIDNNRSERSIKNFVIGRKGWLFCATQKGADASAAKELMLVLQFTVLLRPQKKMA